jgi:hypothetical protein
MGVTSDATDANVTIIACKFDFSVWHHANSRSKRDFIWDSPTIPDTSVISVISVTNVTIETTTQTTSDHAPPQ